MLEIFQQYGIWNSMKTKTGNWQKRIFFVASTYLPGHGVEVQSSVTELWHLSYGMWHVQGHCSNGKEYAISQTRESIFPVKASQKKDQVAVLNYFPYEYCFLITFSKFNATLSEDWKICPVTWGNIYFILIKTNLTSWGQIIRANLARWATRTTLKVNRASL